MIPYEPLATDGERAVKGLCKHNKKERFCAICELEKREKEMGL